MNIGGVSEVGGLPGTTVLHYGNIDPVRPAQDADGYRDVSGRDTQMLAFVARARSLGFPVKERQALFSRYLGRYRVGADVKQLALTALCANGAHLLVAALSLALGLTCLCSEKGGGAALA